MNDRNSWEIPVALMLIFTLCLPLAADDSWFKDFQWREVGPTATGGRVTDIEVHPQNPHHILVASASGGLWETVNNGTTWNCIFENEGTISIGDIAIDPQNPQTIWVGTGEANNQRSSLWGDGVYKSTDGGKSWTNTGLKETHHIGRIVVDPTNSEVVYVAALGKLYSGNEERGLYRTQDGGETWQKVLYISPQVGVVDVVVDPANPNHVFAASYERLRRAWDFDGAGPGSAVYKSTDGGDTWNRLDGGLPSGEIGRIGLAIFPGNSKIMYATVSNQNPAPRRSRSRRSTDEAGEEKSADPENPRQEEDPSQDDADEGSIVDTKLGFRVELFEVGAAVKEVQRGSAAYRAGIRDGNKIVSVGGIYTENVELIASALKNHRDGDEVTVVVEKDGQAVSATLTAAKTVATAPGRPIGGEIYRSEDAGATWTKVNREPVGGNPAYYYGQIRVDPVDDQRVYVLSVPVYVSSDGGKTFSSDGAPTVHVDHHALWINPDNPNHMMLGNDGGFHISYDQSKTWDYVYNLPLAQFYAIGVDMQEPYHVYGGLQDNGSWGGPSKSSGSVGRQEWYRVGGGDGFYVQVDPEDSNIVFSESQFGAIGRRNRATGASRSIRPPQTEGAAHRYNWNSPILMSTHDPRVIYFAGNKLFKSFNRGDDWLEISGDLTTADPERIAGNVPHCTITTIAESRKDKKRLLVGTDDGKVQITLDGGESWTDLTDRFPFRPPNWWCSRVEFATDDKDTAYASFTGYREDDFRPFVFKTTDAGQTWEAIASNLPEGPVNVIKQDPENPTTLYVGTEFGVFVSLDKGKRWHALDQGLPRVSVQDLLVHPRDGDLVIGTHGRGIYVMDGVAPFQHFDTGQQDQPQLYPVRDWTRVARSNSSMFAGDRKRLAPPPATGVAIWYQLPDQVDEDDFSLIVKDKAGKEVANLSDSRDAGLHRVYFPQPRQSSRGGRGGRSRGRSSARAGNYTVELKVGDQTMQQEFEIK
ncbi:MAG: PDZ domain-containing protein [Mariniblastus sp.]|nr:PDZ domain-containing protein [Mariniblastus sp.]